MPAVPALPGVSALPSLGEVQNTLAGVTALTQSPAGSFSFGDDLSNGHLVDQFVSLLLRVGCDVSMSHLWNPFYLSRAAARNLSIVVSKAAAPRTAVPRSA